MKSGSKLYTQFQMCDLGHMASNLRTSAQHFQDLCSCRLSLVMHGHLKHRDLALTWILCLAQMPRNCGTGQHDAPAPIRARLDQSQQCPKGSYKALKWIETSVPYSAQGKVSLMANLDLSYLGKGWSGSRLCWEESFNNPGHPARGTFSPGT